MLIEELNSNNVTVEEAETIRLPSGELYVEVLLYIDLGAYGGSEKFGAVTDDEGQVTRLRGMPESEQIIRLYELIESYIHPEVAEWIKEAVGYMNWQLTNHLK